MESGSWACLKKFATMREGLYVCIENRPRQGDPAFNQKFEDFVLDNDVDIYDYTNEEHCETTRAGLGYDKDHPNDHDLLRYIQ